MATNWPTSVWNPQDPLADDQGMVPFSVIDPGTSVLQSRGLTYDTYREHKGDISDSSIRAWDVMENPFYQAMAEYEGYDWDKLVSQFNKEIGSIEDQPHIIQTPGGTRRRRVTRSGFTTQNVESKYQEFDNYADAEAWAEEHDYNVSDIQLTADFRHQQSSEQNQLPLVHGGVAGNSGIGPNGPYGGGLIPPTVTSSDDDDDTRYWGITDEKWIERFDGWTGSGEKLIKKYKRQDASIIRKGPSAADYGIVREDNNIFAHYGLDRPPADPKELATNYKWNLSKTWKSDTSYVVPPDLKRVNLSGDGKPRSATTT